MIINNFIQYIKNMTDINKAKKLTELDVNTISLVSDKETPAVPKASTKFSVFKTFFKKKVGFTDEQIEKLADIKKAYQAKDK